MNRYEVHYIYNDTEGQFTEVVWADTKEEAELLFTITKPLAVLCGIE